MNMKVKVYAQCTLVWSVAGILISINDLGRENFDALQANVEKSELSHMIGGCVWTVGENCPEVSAPCSDCQFNGEYDQCQNGLAEFDTDSWYSVCSFGHGTGLLDCDLNWDEHVCTVRIICYLECVDIDPGPGQDLKCVYNPGLVFPLNIEDVEQGKGGACPPI